MSDEWVDPFWNVDGPCPTPKEEIRCPICGGVTIIRGYLHHMRPGSPMPFRVDIGMKCTHCAAVWYHGVKMKEEYFAGHGHQFDRRGVRLTRTVDGIIMADPQVAAESDRAELQLIDLIHEHGEVPAPKDNDGGPEDADT